MKDYGCDAFFSLRPFREFFCGAFSLGLWGNDLGSILSRAELRNTVHATALKFIAWYVMSYSWPAIESLIQSGLIIAFYLLRRNIIIRLWNRRFVQRKWECGEPWDFFVIDSWISLHFRCRGKKCWQAMNETRRLLLYHIQYSSDENIWWQFWQRKRNIFRSCYIQRKTFFLLKTFYNVHI